MMTTVNILDKAKADELKTLGFRYIEQDIGGGQKVYVFMRTPELSIILAEKFSNKDFYMGKTLNF